MTAAVRSTHPGQRRRERIPALDYPLLVCALGLLAFGLIMVSSASMSIAEKCCNDPFYYTIRHAIALGLALSAGLLTFNVSVARWERTGTWLFLLGVLVLILVLTPGIGRTVNGATRWIPLGPLNLQPSEFVKLFAIVYVAGYLVRHADAVANRLSGFIRPMILIGIAAALILMQPDFGTTAVMLATVMGLLFLGGVSLLPFAFLIGVVAVGLVALVFLSPYRMQRVISFLDPWQDPFNTGYQLSQALIAFGRGEWLGVGLGNGIQKQFFLPEAHTDFLASVIGEEFGLVGILALIAAFAFLCWRAFSIGARAEAAEQPFAAYVAQGIALWLGLQAFVNLGVNVGFLPTKGLTLPFLSYGSNSLIVGCMAVAILLRIDLTMRQLESDAGPRRRPTTSASPGARSGVEGGSPWARA
ncbi:putative lipid II flippase FtsW [Thiocystis violascens]|uniref:Probable peptidoglycan glycosyltransferase FtsW n=1 Tax=Thiocystis violascens (strain ATCC 17096 / DSM 198 / 6111) TaxID=765911 RepID=I3YB99_THIV6|nr:putative lipid II flippase FtsW [Thiocystis violascens]AFL74267.1 cell division-specific peptidoglycan biosynthesis regulator FtsW [Thiocystis violascens DSM 198]